MKRILLTFALLLILVGAFAQEHLSFKGIPIEGSISSFCQKLQSKGLTKLGSANNITLFVGDFTGRQATIGVGATDDGKNVHSVGVIWGGKTRCVVGRNGIALCCSELGCEGWKNEM